MRKHAAVSALVSWLGCVPAYASDWVVVNSDTDKGITLSIDQSSIASAGKLTKAWVKWVYTTPRDTDDTDPPKKYTQKTDLVYVNCSERTLGLAESIELSPDSKPVSSLKVPLDKVDLTGVSPDSIGETILTGICAGAAKKKKN